MNENYKRKINNRDTYSQACQDLFVLEMLSNKSNGFYFEIGASHPIESSNTYLLESTFFWNGISIEIEEETANYFNSHRKNVCVINDAANLDYSNFFKLYKIPNQIDYLSLDIEPAENTYKALISLPFEDYRFSVITYEHESYLAGDKYMKLSREFLQKNGYQLVVSNVKSRGRDFEDWWIDPNVVPEDVWKRFKSENIEFNEIFK
jgi:hypothetical protein